MAIPKPSTEYLSYCSSSPPIPCEPQRLLVILDVNGTLGFRKQLRSITPRPHLREFLTYLFREHDVAIWTSMTRSNFLAVLPKIMTKEQAAKLKMVWTREDMNLGNNFKDYVQTYKELTKVWAHLNGDEYGPHNTILIDDSLKKALSEPYNHVVVTEWEGPGTVP
ncbi:HAD-like domain-containing protein, partial [Elsinoe ampelina]